MSMEDEEMEVYYLCRQPQCDKYSREIFQWLELGFIPKPPPEESLSKDVLIFLLQWFASGSNEDIEDIHEIILQKCPRLQVANIVVLALDVDSTQNHSSKCKTSIRIIKGITTFLEIHCNVLDGIHSCKGNDACRESVKMIIKPGREETIQPNQNDENFYEIEFIQDKIKMRRCIYYMKSEMDKNICQCGYGKEQHKPTALSHLRREFPIPTSNLKWEYQKNTETVQTNAFGDIEFVGFGGNIRKFVRVDRETPMSTVLELMVNVWGMEKPNLLISVTGGANNFNMKPRLRDVFRRGLMKAAQSTAAWILTGGTHAGVMRHVGEAVKDYGMTYPNQKPVVTIGISPWGAIQNKTVLEDPQGSWPASYRIEEKLNPSECSLDPNHSHFILVDDGTQHTFATEIPFRADLEREISEMRTDTGDHAVSVPVVIVVLEGGQGTLQTVQNALQKNTPAVIIKGSGRVADILAYAYKHAETVEVNDKGRDGRDNKIKHMSSSLEAEVIQQIKNIRFCPEEDIGINIQRIKHCLEKADLIYIFEMESSTDSRDIDVAMLKALLKSNKDKVMDQLRLALAWNRIDIAKSEIFTDDKESLPGNLDDIMLSAVQLDRVDFVELLLDHGVSLTEFLTIKRLLQLYNRVSSKSLSKIILYKTRRMKGEECSRNISLKEIGLLIQKLLGDYYLPHYISDTRYASLDVDAILDGAGPSRTNDRMKKGTKENEPDFQNPSQELFIWAVLNNRHNMAKLFWLHGKDAIAAALVANALLSSMSSRTDDKELCEEIRKHGEEFLNLAVGVLQECYSIDEKKVQSVLTRELTQWGNTTCIMIAVKASNMKFISQTACRNLLKKIWKGEMLQENGTARILVCIICPVLVPLLVQFKEKDDEEMDWSFPATNQISKKRKNPLLRGTTNQNFQKKINSLQMDDSELEGHADEQSVESKSDDKCLCVVQKFSSFYQAPVVIFVHNVISYLVFLGLYSYFLIATFTQHMSALEGILIIWVFSLATDEIRQVATTASNTLTTKIQSYARDKWNIFVVGTILLFIFGMILRAHPVTFEAARVVLAVNLIAFFLRLLQAFSLHKELGPKLVMILHMVRELGYFVVIILVFVVAYGVASYTILFPEKERTAESVMSIFGIPYWNIYGELLDTIEGNKSICNKEEAVHGVATGPDCPSKVAKYVVLVMLGAYMLMTNVLLLNLLIAIFSYTFRMIQENTDMHWHFQRYSLIHEYYSKPILAPPLILFAHIIQLAKYFWRKCKCCHRGFSSSSSIGDAFQRKFPNERELQQWENVIADAFHHKMELENLESTGYRVKQTTSRVDQLENKIDELQEQLQTGAGTMDNAHSSYIYKRVRNMEQQLNSTQKVLQWIVEYFKENQLGSSHLLHEVIDVRAEEKRQEEEKDAESRILVYHMLEGQVKVHTRSRISPYLGTNVLRFEVPNDMVPWDAEFQEYNPPTYTSLKILEEKPYWADEVDLYKVPVAHRNIMFNRVDLVVKTSRVSYLGNYRVHNGIPLNPIGRTGLQGRGNLGRWGPNHAVDPVITRWKYDANGQNKIEHGKPVFEFVAIRRMDTGLWSLPGSIQPSGHLQAGKLKITFTEEALDEMVADHEKKRNLEKQMKKILQNGELIHQGYADDPRNTDNSWLESTVYLYHDEKGVLRHFSLRAGTAEQPATWLTASCRLSLHGAHSYFLKLVAERLDASF